MRLFNFNLLLTSFIGVLRQLQLRWRNMFWQGLKIGYYSRRKWLRWNFHLTASWRTWQEQLHWLQKWTLVLAFFETKSWLRFSTNTTMSPRKELIPRSSVRSVHHLCRVWKSWDCDSWLRSFLFTMQPVTLVHLRPRTNSDGTWFPSTR